MFQKTEFADLYRANDDARGQAHSFSRGPRAPGDSIERPVMSGAIQTEAERRLEQIALNLNR